MDHDAELRADQANFEYPRIGRYTGFPDYDDPDDLPRTTARNYWDFIAQVVVEADDAEGAP